jgi:hypothetical protein
MDWISWSVGVLGMVGMGRRKSEWLGLGKGLSKKEEADGGQLKGLRRLQGGLREGAGDGQSYVSAGKMAPFK